MKGARNLSDIGKLIKYHRQKKSLSQIELAKLAGTTQVTISNLENGNGGTIKAMMKLLNAMELEINFESMKRMNSQNISQFLEP